MSYSFNASLENEQNRQSSYAPSEKQVKLYHELCARKGVQTQDIKGLTRAKLGALIEKVQQLPERATRAQLDKIAELHAQIKEMGGDIKPIPAEFLASLTGGREGTASQVIEKLYERRNKLTDTAPPTEKQLQVLVSWFFCPEIPFESLTIPREPESKVIEVSRRVHLEPLQSWSSDVDNADTLAQRPWRLVTPDEFAQELKAKMNRQDASYVIDNFSGVFYDWRRTRITKEQVQTIRNLEQRMSTTYTPNKVEIAMTDDGEFIELNAPSRQRRAIVGYQPITEEALLQMSVEDASRFIDQLRSESRRSELRAISGGLDDSQQRLTDKHASYDDRSGEGQARDQVTANAKELRATEDVIYALESIVGYRADELHDLINENSVTYSVSGIRADDLNDRFKVMMMDSVDTKRDLSAVLRDLARLTTICEESAFATKIAQEVAKEVLASLDI